MKNILIPFDFGKIGLNAMKYAFQMHKEEAKYVILHILDGNLSLQDPLTYTAGLTRGDSIINEMDRLAAETLAELSADYPFLSEVEVGSTVELIVDKVEKGHFDAVVMGTRDKYDLFDKWLGTVSLGVVKRVGVPVYLIPNQAEYKKINRVVIATDHHLESDRILEYLLEWNANYKADLHFVHIIDQKGKNEGFLRNIVEEYFEKRNLDFPFTVIQKEKGDIVKELINYSEQKEADLQVMITDKMSWLETMVSGSISKKMILKARKPTLFLPSGLKKRSQILFSSAAI
ncbi:universal stress protein [Portibacter marinus]|uniref:universal stress protein n=1 Tax=Portibacter marinus TaxID=2898660 RepID=UPI001F2A5709|nr:universal stress protein [Portibacter marinus]